MIVSEALEQYLFDSGQITKLARRQAQLLCRFVAAVHLHNEAHIVLLLNLAALCHGAPRAPREFLLAPLIKENAERYIAVYQDDHDGTTPAWADTILDCATVAGVNEIVTAALQSPARLAPLTGDAPQSESEAYPLLVVGNLQIGFSRYWRAATALEKNLNSRLQQPDTTNNQCVAAAAVKSVFVDNTILDSLETFHYRQAAAAALALKTSLLIVSGGPGTGKTKMVTQLLRTLIRVYPQIKADRIVLCAPTGRAKARLGESIDSDIARLIARQGSAAVGQSPDGGLENLPRKTLHGLLGVRPDGTLKYTAANPLPYQVVVVDEASMVDLSLFSSLLEAVSADCRIILVGDMNQLPSVEAGAVLGDLTGRFAALDGSPTLTPAGAAWLNAVLDGAKIDKSDGAEDIVLSTDNAVQAAGRLADHAIILTRSYRSAQEILAISGSINRGNVDDALRLIPENNEAAVVTIDQRTGTNPVMEWLNRYYPAEKAGQVRALQELDLSALNDPHHPDHLKTRAGFDAAFIILEQSRILTLAHKGPRGRIAINALAEKLLRPKLTSANSGSVSRFFHGQPVILSENLHDLDLYNGDTGMVVEFRIGGIQVVFKRGKRYVVHALDLLPGIESAFAMTVHKAQGSEFDAVLLVLPERSSPLLSRQIIYTGLTRAKSKVRILGATNVLETAIQTREIRPGGIVLN